MSGENDKEVFRKEVMDGLEKLPIGFIIQIPTRYMPCDGQVLHKGDYPELWRIACQYWGADSKEDWFRVPKVEGCAIICKVWISKAEIVEEINSAKN
jgi:Phage Tail Collar Domain